MHEACGGEFLIAARIRRASAARFRCRPSCSCRAGQRRSLALQALAHARFTGRCRPVLEDERASPIEGRSRDRSAER